MAKNETTTQKAAGADALDAGGQALIAALTAAILSTRQGAVAPDPKTTRAAAEFAEIKGALRTHGEALPLAGSRFPQRSSKGEEY